MRRRSMWSSSRWRLLWPSRGRGDQVCKGILAEDL
jgi:hypothetical protein